MLSVQFIELSDKDVYLKKYVNNGFIFYKLQETIGKDCKVTEPYYNITFDLTPLRKDGGYKINGFDNDQLDFNICGKLNKPCGDSASVAACLDKNNKKFKFGKQIKCNLLNDLGSIFE